MKTLSGAFYHGRDMNYADASPQGHHLFGRDEIEVGEEQGRERLTQLAGFDSFCLNGVDLFVLRL